MHIYFAKGYCRSEKDKNREWEIESAGGFLVVFVLCLEYLTTYIIAKRSKGYVPHLYTWIKYKRITVYIKKAREGTLHFKYVPKGKQNKLRQTKKTEIKEEIRLSP